MVNILKISAKTKDMWLCVFGGRERGIFARRKHHNLAEKLYTMMVLVCVVSLQHA
jgi:hypothetical protein